MCNGRIIIITGSPGTGKTTAAAMAAKESALPRSVYMHTDDFYHYLRKGAIPPHLPKSHRQNRTVIEAFLAAARRFAQDGYDVIVDGIIGPWFLEPWIQAVREGFLVHYVILRADREETIKRAVEREKLDRRTNLELVDVMWDQFCDLGAYEKYVIDTTTLTAEETTARILKAVEEKTHLLH